MTQPRLDRFVDVVGDCDEGPDSPGVIAALRPSGEAFGYVDENHYDALGAKAVLQAAQHAHHARADADHAGQVDRNVFAADCTKVLDRAPQKIHGEHVQLPMGVHRTARGIYDRGEIRTLCWPRPPRCLVGGLTPLARRWPARVRGRQLAAFDSRPRLLTVAGAPALSSAVRRDRFRGHDAESFSSRCSW